MSKHPIAAGLLALGALIALPACSNGMFGHTASAPAYPAPLAGQEVSPAMVRHIQAQLQQQGFYTGTVDGLWGPETQAGVQRFQSARGLKATGELNRSTLAALDAPAAPVAVAPAASPAPTGAATPAAPVASTTTP
jgi:peptidoglycan hydrolase-like protein with peptidoglycan-binding domain